MDATPLPFELQNVQIINQFSRPQVVPPTGGIRAWDTYQVTTLTALPAAPIDAITMSVLEDPFASSRRAQMREAFATLARQPRTVSATEVRRNFAAIAEWTADSGRTVVVTNHGKAWVVIVSYSVFQSVLRSLARELLAARARRTGFVRRMAEDAISDEVNSINRRLRQGADA